MTFGHVTIPFGGAADAGSFRNTTGYSGSSRPVSSMWAL